MATQIGPYRGEPVGRGGFATVYRVEGTGVIPLALKWVDAEAGADSPIVAALYREYEVQSQLVFPQITVAHDLGIHAGRPYMVSDWIDGPTLWENVKNPMAEDCAAWLRQMARVLLFLHQRGWVHGDLKPDNFRWRLGRSGSEARPDSVGRNILCLLDFGLARPVGDLGRPRGAGTIGYCAPEFLRNEPADGRADWYAVGAMLYEWVFAARPFAAPEPAMEITGHLESAPDMDRPMVRPAPEWVREVMARLLAKQPDERGEDEINLLEWMADFDPDLAPNAILNEQLDWHRQSEDRRWDAHDRMVIDEMSAEARSIPAAHWRINGQGAGGDVFVRHAAASLVENGWDVNVRGRDPANGQYSARGESDIIRVEAECRVGNLSRALTVEWSPLPHPCMEEDTAVDGEVRALTQLSWDSDRVAEYLLHLIPDESFVAQWTAPVSECTSGVPRAISSLLRDLIRGGDLRREADGWVLDASGLARWAQSDEAHEIVSTLCGELSNDERELCGWLALGRSWGNKRVLHDMSGLDPARFETAFDRLRDRGVIVYAGAPSTPPCFDTRLRLRGAAAVWRSRLDPVRHQEQARVLAEAIEKSITHPERTRASILADCFADAGLWQKATEQALRSASLSIAADDRAQAIANIQVAETAAGRIADPMARSHWQGRARMVRGDLEKASGQIDQARRTYRELLALCRRTGDRRLLAETLRDLGDLYRLNRNFDKAVRALKMARRLWESLSDRAELSRTLNNLGNVYWVAADLPQARAYYEEARAMQTELGLDEYAATALSNLGAIHLVEYNYVRAEQCLREAHTIHRKLQSPVETARTLNNLGALKFMQGVLEEAEVFFEDAAILNGGAGAQSEEVFNRRNLVEVALERGDLRTVVSMGQEVLGQAEALGDMSTAAEILPLVAEAFTRAGDFRTAERFLERGHETVANLKNDDLRALLALTQVSRHERLGRYDAAQEVLQAALPDDKRLANGHLQMDNLILRLQIARHAGSTDSARQLWEEGKVHARAIGAMHKGAQLAFVWLGPPTARDFDQPARETIDQFLRLHPRWHWVGAYRLWTAQRLLSEGHLDSALAIADDAVTQLRQEGNWETLWRALTVKGRLLHDQADYEPALRALDEAARVFEAVSATIDDAEDRECYCAHPLAELLAQTRERIHQLVA